MKKIYLSVLTLLAAGSLSAQGFWTPTAYKGAFPVTDGMSGTTSNNWAAGWANWDPQNASYASTNVTVSSDITANTTWATGSVVLLQNKVYVTNGATLTIEPGVIIRGDQATGGALIISRGSKINAQGTQTNPIVFTSNQAAGSRNLGDWGGVIILGNAKNNQAGGVAVIEGGLDPIKGQFGGNDDSDSSGVFSYVRIEFGGIPFQTDKEINGLTLGSVGSKTKIDHVQCSFTNDDSFEWFGGTVNAKYLIAYRGLDDDFDTDFGFRGNIQFGLVVRDPDIADQSSSSTSEGFESDNDATGTEAWPHTAPVFSNITVVGPYRGATSNTIDAKFRRALRLRRNTYTSVFNSIFTDFPTGLHLDGSAAQNNALSDSLRFENNLFSGMGTNLDATMPGTIPTWFTANNNTTTTNNAATLMVAPYNFTAGDYRLSNGSAASTGADFTDGFVTAGGVITPASTSWWTCTSYIGAFPGTDGMSGTTSNNWAAGWANWDPQNASYASTNVTVSSDITANTTWATGSVVLLQNKVYVTNGATLTIEPGVIIRGDQATGGALIISRGSKINAQGTQTNPIVFTSNQAAGSRNLGDWGGVIILGNAKNNQAGGVAVIEGGLDPIKGQFGGNDDSDSSGVFSYVRIEFGGIPFQTDKEINGLTLGSVGSKTKIDHVQCSFTNDDSFEWFGGTVNAKYLIAYRGLDDDFDTDFGFRGNIQFGLVVRDPDIADQSSSSTSEGFESDNDATGTEAWPHTAPVFSNITVVGPYRGATSNTIDAKFRRALRLRRNTYTSVFNSIFTDFPTGLHLDGSAAQNNALSDSLRFENNLFSGMGTNLDATMPGTIPTWFTANNNTTTTNNAATLMVAPYNFTAGDYRLSNGSIALTGANFTDGFIGLASCFTVGVKENNSFTKISSINLYPNPAVDALNIDVLLNTNEKVSISIFDITGKLVSTVIENSEMNAGTNTVNISTSNLSNGLYFVSVSSGNFVQTQKLVISK